MRWIEIHEGNNMSKKLLIDTDVIIDYLRNYVPAVNFLENLKEQLLISAITIAELYAGIRDQDEQHAVENFLRAFEVIPTDAEIAQLGGNFRKKYGKSHGTGLADALIAASAFHKQAHLVTLNIRHYPMVVCIKPYDKKIN